MDSTRFRFNVSLAGIPFQICCQHKENYTFLQDYLTDHSPFFTVEPSGSNLSQIRQRFDRTAVQEGVSSQDYPEWFLENNAIHAIIAENLVSYDVLLLHGSALCMDGDAYIFTAPSGTGKSTHSRLWREVFGERVWMINDDKPMLRVEAGSVAVYGTPWNGKHRLSCNASAPLKAIVSLTRSAENHIRPIPAAQAFTVLRHRAYISPCEQTSRKILVLENKLLSEAEFYALECNMTRDAAVVAWQGMNPQKTLQ